MASEASYIAWQLIHTVPACISLESRCAWLRLSVQTLAASPNWLSFAASITASTLLNRWAASPATSATLKDVVIDDFFFGVSAVTKDGWESPVVFPGAAGSFESPPPAVAAPQ